MPASKTFLIDFNQISQKKIRAYMADKGLTIRTDFDKLATTCYLPAEKDTYYTHSKAFTVGADLPTVWSTYLHIPPRDTWKCKMVSFGCMYCKSSRELTYMDDEYEGLRVGQILFLNVGLFWGMVNIAVAHQITQINEAEKFIEFSYIKGGETEGSQRLIFESNGDNTTTVTHRTTYRGRTRSFFREKILYPVLHTRVIAAFHRNVRQKILLKASQ
ncbi:MAG: hypothetical protein KKG00_00065 [Bacteroidetes bacterium]|nr:hypothetical protein [Bacteroidota bacterium]